MPKVFYCSECTNEHPRPVGKKCQHDRASESFSSADEVAAPPMPSKEITASDQILCQLRVLGEKWMGVAYRGCTGTGQLTCKSGSHKFSQKS